MGYYFLAASLPMLSMENPPGISIEEFAQRCAEQLSPADQTAIKALETGFPYPPLHPLLAEWNAIETEIRNHCVRARASRIGVDPTPHMRPQAGMDAFLEHRVSEALTRANPLDREQALDRVRWNQLEHLAGFDAFSSRAMVAYGLKLRLATRWAAHQKTAGQQKLEEALAESTGPRAGT